MYIPVRVMALTGFEKQIIIILEPGGAGTAARSVSRKYTPETFADDSNQLFILQLQATSSRDVFWGKSEATLTIIKKFKLGLKLIETNSKLIDCESKSPTSLK